MINGYSFLYPSDFQFTHDFSGMSEISNSVNGVSLIFTFIGGDQINMCTSEESFISNPRNLPGRTYSKEVIKQGVVYKYFVVDTSSNPSYFARYSLVHDRKCLQISESSNSNDFSILNSILNSVTFR